MTGFQGLVWYSKLDRTLTYIKVSICSRVVLVLASSFRKDGVREFGHRVRAGNCSLHSRGSRCGSCYGAALHGKNVMCDSLFKNGSVRLETLIPRSSRDGGVEPAVERR